MSAGYHRMGANSKKGLIWDNRLMDPSGAGQMHDLVDYLSTPVPLTTEGKVGPELAKDERPVDESPFELGKPKITREVASGMGYTGDACDHCGSMRMKVTGHCNTCEECGTTTGCS